MRKRMGYRDWRWLALWWHHLFILWSTIDGQTRYTIPEELKRGSVVGNLAKDLGLGLSEIFDRKLRVASEAGKQYFSVDAGKGEIRNKITSTGVFHSINHSLLFGVVV
uniref:Cadherin N-terminal domain-containing protein n=1 Tax=Oncorhynchus kisutch TaxID=8019 RepID=A0A8C7L291_ONCKI